MRTLLLWAVLVAAAVGLTFATPSQASAQYYYYPTYYYGYPYYGPYYGGYPYDSGYDYSGGYVEQGSGGSPQAVPAPSQPRAEYSYYCPDPAGYYPQVATCPKGWLRVVPQNAPGPTSPAY